MATRRSRNYKVISLVTLACLILAPEAVFAHPSHSNYVDTSSNFQVTPSQVSLDYYVHYSSSKSSPLISEMGGDASGKVSDQARRTKAGQLCANYSENLEFSVGNIRLDQTAVVSSLQIRPGSNSSKSITVRCKYVNTVEFFGSQVFDFSDKNIFEGAPGLHEFTFQTLQGVTSNSKFPETSLTTQLTDYSKINLRTNVHAVSINLKYPESSEPTTEGTASESPSRSMSGSNATPTDQASPQVSSSPSDQGSSLQGDQLATSKGKKSKVPQAAIYTLALIALMGVGFLFIRRGEKAQPLNK